MRWPTGSPRRPQAQAAEAPETLRRTKYRLGRPPGSRPSREAAPSPAAPVPVGSRVPPGPARAEDAEDLTGDSPSLQGPAALARQAGKELPGKGTGPTGRSVRAPVNPPGPALPVHTRAPGEGKEAGPRPGAVTCHLKTPRIRCALRSVSAAHEMNLFWPRRSP